MLIIKILFTCKTFVTVKADGLKRAKGELSFFMIRRSREAERKKGRRLKYLARFFVYYSQQVSPFTSDFNVLCITAELRRSLNKRREMFYWFVLKQFIKVTREKWKSFLPVFLSQPTKQWLDGKDNIVLTLALLTFSTLCFHQVFLVPVNALRSHSPPKSYCVVNI